MDPGQPAQALRVPRRNPGTLREHFVEPGQLDPDNIHTPGIFVDRVILGSNYEKRIEFRTTRPREETV